MQFPPSRLEALEHRRLLAAEIAITDESGADDDLAVEFADTNVDETSEALRFTVANDGDSDLDITDFAVGGVHDADFDVAITDESAQEVSGPDFSIAPGSYVNVAVNFAPVAVGQRTGEITFSTNDADEADITLSLSGTGINLDAPAAPTGLNAVAASDSRVNLTWTDNADDEQGFAIYQASSAEGPFTVKAVVDADATSYTRTGLTGYTRYYFRVTAFSADGESDPAADDVRTPARADTQPNNTQGTAIDLGTLNGPRVFRNFVGDNDLRDYYKTTLSAKGILRAACTEVDGTINLQVLRLNSDGSTTSLATKTGTGSVIINLTDASARTYFVRVARSGTSNSNFRLQVTPDYSGNSLALARNTGALTASKFYYDSIGVSDTRDFYKFTLSSSKKVSLSLSSLAIDADLDLLSSTGATIVRSESEGTTTERISRTLAAGTYYVRVFPYSPTSDTQYKLSFSVA